MHWPCLRGERIWPPEQGLILVDTKYEFGNLEGTVYLIDEVHTPDSSRYFYADTYEENQNGRFDRKNNCRKNSLENGLLRMVFRVKPDKSFPAMSDEWVNQITTRYIELFETVTGQTFQPADAIDPLARIEANILTGNHRIKSRNEWPSE